jgi:uncharacterized protein
LSVYADTSALVPLLVTETHTPRVMTWLAKQAPGTIVISDWSHTEVASALSLKLRIGEITLPLRAAAFAAWTRLHTSSLPTLAVTSDHFEVAAGIAARHDLGMRAGDALHLAIALDGGHRLVTFDARMAAAAPVLGIPVEPL